MLDRNEICGVILAGGQSRRMGGGDKCLAALAGKTLLRYSLDIVAPQVGPLLINSNSDPELFSEYDYPVVADVVAGFVGPLAGILTGMEWALEKAPECAWIASFASDAPFIPNDLVKRLILRVENDGADMACAYSGGRYHPVFAIWPVHLAGSLRAAIVESHIRKVDSWTALHNLGVVEYPVDRLDPFFNINLPEDLKKAEKLLQNHCGRASKK